MTLFNSLGKFVHELLFPTYRVEPDGFVCWRIVDRQGNRVDGRFVTKAAAKRRILELLEGK